MEEWNDGMVEYWNGGILEYWNDGLIKKDWRNPRTINSFSAFSSSFGSKRHGD